MLFGGLTLVIVLALIVTFLMIRVQNRKTCSSDSNPIVTSNDERPGYAFGHFQAFEVVARAD
jgi:hypothetical protein